MGFQSHPDGDGDERMVIVNTVKYGWPTPQPWHIVILCPIGT